MMLQSTSTLLPSGVFVWDPVSNKPVPFTLNGANAADQLVFQGTQYQPELCRTFEQHRRQALFQTLELQQQLTQQQTQTQTHKSTSTSTINTAPLLFSAPRQHPPQHAPQHPSAPCLLHFTPQTTEPQTSHPTYGGLLHSVATPRAAFSTAPTQHGSPHKGVDAALVEWEEKRARKRSRVWEPREDECLAQAAAQYGGKMWKRIAQRVQQLLSHPSSSPSSPSSSGSIPPHRDSSDDQQNDAAALPSSSSSSTSAASPRTADQCCQRWTRVLAPRMARARWSDRRDALLLSLAQASASASLPPPSASDPTRTDTQSLATIDTDLFDRLDWLSLAAQMAFHDATPAACRYRFFHLRRLAKDALRSQRRLLSASASASVVDADADVDSSAPLKLQSASPTVPLSASSSLSQSSSSPTPLPFVSSRAHMLRIEALLN